MNVRRFLTTALAVIAPATSALLLGVAAPAATAAAAAPCGFYETSTDARYNHCTSDGSRVVIEVEVFGPNYEKCVGPGDHWLGSSSKIDGAHYVGRTC